MTKPDELVTPLVVDGLVNQGLTKREYFAALAMQAFIDKYQGSSRLCAENAVIWADALIKALNQ